jgi:hypothetical protein
LNKKAFCANMTVKELYRPDAEGERMDIEQLIYSFAPIVVILIISWVLGGMRTQAKKPAKKEEPTLADLLGMRPPQAAQRNAEEEDFLVPGTQRQTESPERSADPNMGRTPSFEDLRPPVATPEPIKPKWWGA